MKKWELKWKKMRKKIKKINHGQVHSIAQCTECHWSDEGMNSAAREATKHCKISGHRISVERGLVYTLTLE